MKLATIVLALCVFQAASGLRMEKRDESTPATPEPYTQPDGGEGGEGGDGSEYSTEKGPNAVGKVADLSRNVLDTVLGGQPLEIVIGKLFPSIEKLLECVQEFLHTIKPSLCELLKKIITELTKALDDVIPKVFDLLNLLIGRCKVVQDEFAPGKEPIQDSDEDSENGTEYAAQSTEAPQYSA